MRQITFALVSQIFLKNNLCDSCQLLEYFLRLCEGITIVFLLLIIYKFVSLIPAPLSGKDIVALHDPNT